MRLHDLYRIEHYIDTFALGHYARVLDAIDRRVGRMVAFKVMRPEHVATSLNGMDEHAEVRWEMRAFANEASLLARLADDPYTVRLYDCGFVEARAEAPNGGEIVSYEQNVDGFGRDLADYATRGWRPYLSLELLPRANNLFYCMRPDRQGSRMRLPTEEGIALALQFAETLRRAHAQGIVYLDHKLEHLYWDGVRLRIIDWNSSRAVDVRARENGAVFRQDIHNLCVGILYSIFTGLSPQKTALRPQPGSQSEVENRYAEITALDFGVEPTLSPSLQAVIRTGAENGYDGIDDFISALRTVAAEHGWDMEGRYTNPADRDARAHLRDGLARLRKGEEAIREARDLFREAAILDGINSEVEAELRRLVVATNDMLNNRVIP
jgi:serine/threonine protein kinase